MTSAPATSYWCYRCSRLVRIWPREAIVCPDCDGGFLEEAAEMPPTPFPSSAEPRRRRFPASVMWMDNPSPRPRQNQPSFADRRSRRTASGDRSSFNPVIVLRNPSEAAGGGAVGRDVDSDRPSGTFELYYDDGSGSGLRPLPASMSDFLMGSGFDRLLDQLAQIEVNAFGRQFLDHPPASKAAVESMPTIEIEESHVGMDSHCAVCKDPFELGTEVREMPCKHIYHQDCILPWLSIRNSCPVCRHEMPTQESAAGDERLPARGSEEDGYGLTIWRLPGGGFAVGRFSGGRRTGERELPVVYTEMDGGFNNGGAPRRISWSSRGGQSRDSRGIGRAFRNFFSFFRRRGTSSSSSSSSLSSLRNGSESGSSSPSQRSQSGSIFSRRNYRRSNSSGWALEERNA